MLIHWRHDCAIRLRLAIEFVHQSNVPIRKLAQIDYTKYQRWLQSYHSRRGEARNADPLHWMVRSSGGSEYHDRTVLRGNQTKWRVQRRGIANYRYAFLRRITGAYYQLNTINFKQEKRRLIICCRPASADATAADIQKMTVIEISIITAPQDPVVYYQQFSWIAFVTIIFVEYCLSKGWFSDDWPALYIGYYPL